MQLYLLSKLQLLITSNADTSKDARNNDIIFYDNFSLEIPPLLVLYMYLIKI
jgi:hypothetical protein